MVAYALAIGGAFVLVGMLPRETSVTLRDLRGLARVSPTLAGCLLVFVASLAGLPPTIGLWGKVFLFEAAVSGGFLWLALIGLCASAVGVFYYLRIIVHLFMMPPAENSDLKPIDSPLQVGVLVATATAIVVASLLPQALLGWLGQ